MLVDYEDTTTSQHWDTFYKYDSSGRLILQAQPSAVTGYNDTYADLVHSVSGNYQYLSDSTGLIQTIDYYSSTTATTSTAGGVAGSYQDWSVQQGETGTAVLQDTATYIARTVGSLTFYPVASDTVYRNTNGTGGETTSYSYTWFSSTLQPQSVTVTLPTISSGQNGPGSADTNTTYFDAYGRPIWTKDGDGFLNYTAYDPVTGAVTKFIQDVDTTQTGNFSNLPSGWSTPSWRWR